MSFKNRINFVYELITFALYYFFWINFNMNILQKLQEQYVNEFNANIPLDEFLLNIFVVAILVSLLRIFYIRYGNSHSNRKKFAANFLPLALSTLLVIMIVKSSIALSLGLVGALSIVRFRAAIKDPEELTYLFFTIGIGLAGGANQPILAVVSFLVIISLLFLNKVLTNKVAFKNENRMYVNIQTDENDLKKITKILTDILPYVELKRMDMIEQGLDLSYICKTESIDQLDQLKNNLSALSPNTKLSIIDQPDLIV
jgi:uncharacterized membrane protein YhiD involved in acid resistance